MRRNKCQYRESPKKNINFHQTSISFLLKQNIWISFTIYTCSYAQRSYFPVEKTFHQPSAYTFYSEWNICDGDTSIIILHPLFNVCSVEIKLKSKRRFIVRHQNWIPYVVLLIQLIPHYVMNYRPGLRYRRFV